MPEYLYPFPSSSVVDDIQIAVSNIDDYTLTSTWSAILEDEELGEVAEGKVGEFRNAFIDLSGSEDKRAILECYTQLVGGRPPFPR